MANLPGSAESDSCGESRALGAPSSLLCFLGSLLSPSLSHTAVICLDSLYLCSPLSSLLFPLPLTLCSSSPPCSFFSRCLCPAPSPTFFFLPVLLLQPSALYSLLQFFVLMGIGLFSPTSTLVCSLGFFIVGVLALCSCGTLNMSRAKSCVTGK